MKNIMFMGTPEISAICLKKLIEDGHGISAVITREDKPRGRGNVMTPTPVKVLAEEHNIPVHTPKTLRDEAFAELLECYKPELIVVVAYGKILPLNVIEYPKFGCVNLHVSLLPKYRGAAPMQRAIMAGEEETGVTTMRMDAGLDTGDILLVERFPIGKDDNFETVHDRSAEIGGALLCRTLTGLLAGTLTPVKQEEHLATYADKITKEDCAIDFSLPARVLHARIRGLSPIPLAFTHLPNGKLLKIVSARLTEGKGRPGEIIRADKDGAVVACGDGALLLGTVLPEGKGKMSSSDLVRGRQLSVGDLLA